MVSRVVMINTPVLPVLSVLPVLASLLSFSQCFLLDAFLVENRTETASLSQEQPEPNHNSIEENTETNIIETKMKEVERPPHLPYFVVLRQSGGKKHQKKDFASSISKRQGGVLQGLTNVVSNTR